MTKSLFNLFPFLSNNSSTGISVNTFLYVPANLLPFLSNNSSAAGSPTTFLYFPSY